MVRSLQVAMADETTGSLGNPAGMMMTFVVCVGTLRTSYQDRSVGRRLAQPGTRNRYVYRY